VIDTEVAANSFRKSTGKLFAVMGGEIVRYALFADHVFEEHSCYLWGVNVLSAGEVDCHFSHTVDNYQDPGVSRSC